MVPGKQFPSINREKATMKVGKCAPRSMIKRRVRNYKKAFGDGRRNSEYGKLTRKTPELAYPSPNFHDTLTAEYRIIDIFNVHRLLHTTCLQLYMLELMTCLPRVISLNF
ncbi:hypothetical protein TNCV_745291 [Trichonephila clavipes]|nr:hypothetical protein TNCV_745291 [Trichonephila clavipes]